MTQRVGPTWGGSEHRMAEKPKQGEPHQDDSIVDGDGAHDQVRQIVLVKKGRRYVFRYELGEETKLLHHLVGLVQKGEGELDWFDAALLSHQMGRRLGNQLEQMTKPI